MPFDSVIKSGRVWRWRQEEVEAGAGKRCSECGWECGWDGVGGAGGQPGSSVVVRRRWYWRLARQLWYDVGGAGGWPSSTGLSAAVWAVVTETCCGLGSLRRSLVSQRCGAVD